MARRVYLGGVSGRAGNYGIVFPDFLGCVSVGESMTEIVAMGREALQLHVDSMAEDDDRIPEPTSVDFDRLDAEFSDPTDPDDVDPWVAVVAINVEVPSREEVVNVSLKADLVRQIAEQSLSTSIKLGTRQFIENAVEHELERFRKSA